MDLASPLMPMSADSRNNAEACGHEYRAARQNCQCRPSVKMPILPASPAKLLIAAAAPMVDRNLEPMVEATVPISTTTAGGKQATA
jgi:hypothetical protein